MNNEHSIYRDLQRHLDKQAVGFPAIKSGAEINVLKLLFSPEEAALAMHLNYKLTSLEQIHQSVNDNGMSIDWLESMLEGMAKKGVIMHRLNKEGLHCYQTIPFVVGMYEGQKNRLRPEVLTAFDQFTTDKAFGLSFLSTELPQMRTIPIEKSITVKHKVLTYDTLVDIINNSKGPFAIQKCICREMAKMKGNPCKKTTREETCMAIGIVAENSIRHDSGREISKDQALEIARENQNDGLVLQPGNSQEVDFICACCGCCCGMLGIQKMLPRPLDFWATNHYASVNAEQCIKCEKCINRCQVNALAIDKETGVAAVNLSRCIGCGNCIVECKQMAISLITKEKISIPPKTPEDLYDIIMENKKGVFGMIKLILKLVLVK